ncbi:MAG: MBL fold metallo-hydrolase [Pseudomonadota bacterium]
MAFELFNKNNHINISFSDLVTGEEGVQSNQFLLIDDGHAALVDPGGELTYTRLFMAVSDYINIKNLDYVFASHQDPDIVASINRWLHGTDCQLICPAIWDRFIPHFARSGKTAGRMISVPDEGMNITLGRSVIKALPAHFLHSEGNFQFYDPTSKILFSGDMGANLCPGVADEPVTDIKEVLPYMEGFHRRYMNSNKVCRYWAGMVRELDMDWMVPQHGRPFKGRKVINQFLDWIEQLECGTDLMSQANYRVP